MQWESVYSIQLRHLTTQGLIFWEGLGPYDLSGQCSFESDNRILIIFGGLGFLVILDILKQKRFRKLTLHSKVVIVTSLVLLVAGTVILKLTEM